jgi:hypothetical protein
MAEQNKDRQPIPLWHFINYLLMGCCFLWLAANHFQRHKIGEGWLMIFASALFIFMAFYYRKRGMPRHQFDQGSPFYFFRKWDWETLPPGWRKAVLTLAFWAGIFGLVTIVLPNPAGLFFGLMSGWFFYQLFRLLWRVRACQAHPARHPGD